MRTAMKVMTELNKLTYAVQHNPNCPKPFHPVERGSKGVPEGW